MLVSERKGLIKRIEKALGARVLTVVTGDRQGMATRIAPDILPLVAEHLSRIGPTERLALFLYTPGGDTIAGWGLINLIRQYCEYLEVLVPFRVLSCGTLIAMGADNILMGKHGLLSPVDPSVASPFNPPAPGSGAQPGQVSLLPVSVEDMTGFLELARKELGLSGDVQMIQVLTILADKVHPLALGAVYRAREQVSSLATRLLLRHMKDETRVNQIVKQLTQELPTHSYLIGRKEAADEIKLHITEPSSEVEEAMWTLYKQYEGWLHLTTPVSSEQDLGTDQHKRVRYQRAAIESLNDQELFQYIYTTEKELVKVAITPPGMQTPVEQIAERVVYEGWIAASDGEVL